MRHLIKAGSGLSPAISREVTIIRRPPPDFPALMLFPVLSHLFSRKFEMLIIFTTQQETFNGEWLGLELEEVKGCLRLFNDWNDLRVIIGAKRIDTIREDDQGF
jgi:hypothetical protein